MVAGPARGETRKIQRRPKNPSTELAIEYMQMSIGKNSRKQGGHASKLGPAKKAAKKTTNGPLSCKQTAQRTRYTHRLSGYRYAKIKKAKHRKPLFLEHASAQDPGARAAEDKSPFPHLSAEAKALVQTVSIVTQPQQNLRS